MLLAGKCWKKIVAQWIWTTETTRWHINFALFRWLSKTYILFCHSIENAVFNFNVWKKVIWFYTWRHCLPGVDDVQLVLEVTFILTTQIGSIVKTTSNSKCWDGQYAVTISKWSPNTLHLGKSAFLWAGLDHIQYEVHVLCDDPCMKTNSVWWGIWSQ